MGRPRIIRQPSDVAAVLAFRRYSLSLTQAEVAEAARSQQSMVSYYETGKCKPSLRVLLRLADALDMDVALIPRSGDG